MRYRVYFRLSNGNVHSHNMSKFDFVSDPMNNKEQYELVILNHYGYWEKCKILGAELIDHEVVSTDYKRG